MAKFEYNVVVSWNITCRHMIDNQIAITHQISFRNKIQKLGLKQKYFILIYINWVYCNTFSMFPLISFISFEVRFGIYLLLCNRKCNKWSPYISIWPISWSSCMQSRVWFFFVGDMNTLVVCASRLPEIISLGSAGCQNLEMHFNTSAKDLHIWISLLQNLSANLQWSCVMSHLC